MNRIYAKLLAAAALAICAIAPASAQTPVTVSAWGTPVTIVGGGKPNGPAMLDQNGQIPVVNLGNALSSYVTQTGLTTALAGYLPKNGGTVQDLTVGTSFTPPAYTYASLPASCAAGQIVYITNGYKFWSAIGASPSGGTSTPIYQDSGSSAAAHAGSLAVCTAGQKGTLAWLPLLMNTTTAGW